MGATKPMWMTKGILVKRMRMAATGAAALAAVAVIGACGNSATTEATSPVASSSTQTPTTAQAAAPNHADMMFAHMMVPHHQQAIEMSDIILAKPGIDPRVVELARQIKAAQGPEIAQLQDWMKQWGMPGMGHGGMGEMPGMGHGGMGEMPGMGDGGMSGMDGMLSPAEMDALKSAQRVEASKLFLTGMIAHHQGAITMAQNEIKNGQFPDAVSMAKSIVESQQQEIDEMNGILSSL
jgi:uncharacterized protein (DUF305 family)